MQQASALPCPPHRAAETSEETSVSDVFKPMELRVDGTHKNPCWPPCAWLPISPDSYALFLEHTGTSLFAARELGELLLVWNLNRPVVSCLGVAGPWKMPSVRARARHPAPDPVAGSPMALGKLLDFLEPRDSSHPGGYQAGRPICLLGPPGGSR